MTAICFQFLETTLKVFPLKTRLSLVKFFGSLFGSLPHQKKKSVDENLSVFFDLKSHSRTQIRQEIFENFAVTLHDFFFPEGIKIHVPQRQKLEELHEEHGGLMILTFHMGCWELGAHMMKNWGWSVSAVYQPYENEKLKQVIQRKRAKGVQFIPVGQKAALSVIKALKKGKVVAMLGDHPYGEEGVSVQLLGKEVKLPKGPVVLAARAGAPIVIAALIKREDRFYEAHFEEPLFVSSYNGSFSVQETVQEVANKYGKLLVQHPSQWYRFDPLEERKAA